MNGGFGSNVGDDNDEDDSPVLATQPREEYHELAALTDAYRTLGMCLVTSEMNGQMICAFCMRRPY